ncbi:MAG: type and secretion system protein [Bryobacterales bacterium]|nr:type and secretion system protein [Bryobacterales bacterium]
MRLARQFNVKVRLAFAALLFVTAAFGSKATNAVKRARKAEKAGKISEAYLLYAEASDLAPRNKIYRAKAAALEARAAISSNVMPADGPPPREETDPSAVFDDWKPGEPQPPPELNAKPGRFNLDLHGDYKGLFQQVAQLYGLDTIFDSDYDQGRLIRFRLDNVDYREALHGLEAATGSFVTPISSKLFMVAKDTPQKRTDLEQTITVSIPIPQAMVSQELIELSQAVRQVMDIQKIAWDTKSNHIVMRDRVSRVGPARALFEALLSYRPQVVVDLQLIEIRKSDITNFGATIPNMFKIAFTGVANNVTTTTTGSLPSSFLNPFPFGSRSYDFLAIATQAGGSVMQNALHSMFPTSLSLFSIGIGEATAIANYTQSVGRNILTAELRASDAQAATFHMGDRYPIVTGSYSVGTSVQAQFVPPPAFTFEDLGFTLKVTPHIHGMEEVTLDVDSDFKLLTGQSVNGNPVISTRKLKANLRLRDDEWGVVAGLVSQAKSRTVNGTVGLSQVPLLGRIFSQRMKEIDDTEILILMKPRLLNVPGVEKVVRQLRVGTDVKPFLPL